MNLEEDYEALMRRHVQGLLSTSEQQKLEDHLDQHPEARLEMDEIRFQQQVMDEIVARDLRTKISSWSSTIPHAGQVKRWMWWTLGVIFTFLLLWLAMRQPNPVAPAPPAMEQPAPPSYTPPSANPEHSKRKEPQPATSANKPIAQAFQAKDYAGPIDHFSDQYRGNDSDPQKKALRLLVTDADRAYQQNDRLKAVQLMEKAVTDYPKISHLQLLLAKLYLEQSQYARAIGLLKPLTEQNSAFAQEAEWNLLLCELSLNGTNAESTALWRKIRANPNHFAFEAAGRLPILPGK